MTENKPLKPGLARMQQMITEWTKPPAIPFEHTAEFAELAELERTRRDSIPITIDWQGTRPPMQDPEDTVKEVRKLTYAIKKAIEHAEAQGLKNTAVLLHNCQTLAREERGRR